MKKYIHIQNKMATEPQFKKMMEDYEELRKRAKPLKPKMSGANQGLVFHVCPNCDKPLPHNSKFCSQCGQAIDSMVSATSRSIHD